MKHFVFSLLFSLLAFTTFSQTPTVLNNYVDVLRTTSLSELTNRLKEKGYTESTHPAFKEKNLRLFTTEGRRGVELYLLEYCGSELTGYYTSLNSMEHVILTNDLDKYKYKNVGSYFQKYRKGDITIDVVSDPSVDHFSNQSDTYGYSKYYLHVSKKNNCHNDNLASPMAPAYPFEISSAEEINNIMGFTRADVVVALAKSGYFEDSYEQSTGLSQFKRGNQSIVLQFCENKVKVISNYLSKGDGERLEENIKKKGFTQSQEQKGKNNSYARVYETKDLTVLVQYTGDVANESSREIAYRLIAGKKNTPCEEKAK